MSKRALDSRNDTGGVYWTCNSCHEINLREKHRCKRCKRQQGSVKKAKSDMGWAEAIDPVSKHVYYYNSLTGVSQWTRPLELDRDSEHQTASNTGWFGRGKSGAGERYMQDNERYLGRTARRQQETLESQPHHTEHAGSYNIWYGTYSGEYNKNRGAAAVDAATSRCVVERDAGETNADHRVNTDNASYFCMHFAKGTCVKGADCTFFHRVPAPVDDGFMDNSVDCFGRVRHAEHREDMEGTGSFNKPSRTLYVGQLRKESYDTSDALVGTLWRHFGEWGEVEHISLLKDKPVAFVRYRMRSSAEFAREAMKGQSLDRREVLAVKWAHDDPNVKAQKEAAEADLKAAVMAAHAKQEAQREEKQGCLHEETDIEEAKAQALSRLLGKLV